MTIGVCDLISCVNACIQGSSTLSALDYVRLSSVSKDFEANLVYSVANVASLPAAANNKGRMIYVDDVNGYRISDGTSWTNDFTSTPVGSSTIYSWGAGSLGKLGNNTDSVVKQSSPVSVVGGFTDWCQVSVGGKARLGIRRNCTLWAWGDNQYGGLGDGTTVNKSSPVSVVGGFTDWCQVSTGTLHTVALRTNGTAWAWGQGRCGRLGDGTTVCKSSPVSVLGGFTDWQKVSAGGEHTLALKTNGSLWSWGFNTAGQLGDGTTTPKSSPISVIGGFADWCQVGAGWYQSFGIRTNGSLWSWGCNRCGALGDDTTVNKSSPVSVVGGYTDWCQVASGRDHAIAVRTNGTAWGWGRNFYGKVGDGTEANKSSPVSVVGGFTDWCQVTATENFSMGVRTNGSAWAWGYNFYGNLGDNTTINKSSPISVIGGLTNWCQVSAGGGGSAGINVPTPFKGFTAV